MDAGTGPYADESKTRRCAGLGLCVVTSFWTTLSVMLAILWLGCELSMRAETEKECKPWWEDE